MNGRRAFIELYSDTRTRPTAAMRRAMAEAEVGDEQVHEDPTVNRLCEAVCALTGKEAAVYLPSGTMCNQIAVMVHCRPGDEILLDRTSHLIHFEAGGASALAGATLAPLDGHDGIFTADQLAARIRTGRRHTPPARLVCVEQTCNLGGGRIWPLERILEVCGTARTHGLATHMDGARLMNAVAGSGVSAARFCAPFDSCWIDFSKGLGAPVGAVLAGSRDFIEQAWRYKHMLGGAMRQAGVLAAACLHALEHHVDRLAEDHANARALASGLAALPGVRIDPGSVETNLVFFEIAQEAGPFLERLMARGVRMGAMGPHRIRAVTHLDVDREDIDTALAAVEAALAG